jgi:hypothetical protein
MDFSQKPFASVAALLLLGLFTACSPATEEPAALAQPSRGAHRGDKHYLSPQDFADLLHENYQLVTGPHTPVLNADSLPYSTVRVYYNSLDTNAWLEAYYFERPDYIDSLRHYLQGDCYELTKTTQGDECCKEGDDCATPFNCPDMPTRILNTNPSSPTALVVFVLIDN